MAKYPYKFLDAYTSKDKDIFFGRNDEINILFEFVFQAQIVVLYGPLGVGKTSLIECGLANKFKNFDWFPLYIRRGNNWNYNLDKALCEYAELGFTEIPEKEISVLYEVIELTKKLELVYLNSFRPIYLILDQFEELYTRGEAGEQEIFIKNIKKIIRTSIPVKIIISIREEYLGHFYHFEKEVPTLLNKRLRVEPMNYKKVEQVLFETAEYSEKPENEKPPKFNIRLQPGEEEKIAMAIFEKIKGNDSTLGVQLPYLQIFLDKLYLCITNDALHEARAVFSLNALEDERIKSIENVLREFLEEQIVKIRLQLSSQFFVNVDTDILWGILSPFVTLIGTKEPLSENILLERLPDLDANLVKAAVKAFEKSRILRNENSAYELTHDALCQPIAEKRNKLEIEALEAIQIIKNVLLLRSRVERELSEKEFDTIEPFIEKIRHQLSAEEQKLVDNSHKKIKNSKKWREIIWLLVPTLFIFSLMFMATLIKWIPESYQEVEKYLFRASVFMAQNKHSAILYDSNLVSTIYYDRIRHLSFANYDMSQFPSEILSCKQMKKLDLSGNKLTVLPIKISNLDNLIGLDISQNALNSVPKQILELKNLEELDLSYNQLKVFPDVDEKTDVIKLKKLDLSNNALKSFPKTLSKIKNLTYLNLHSAFILDLKDTNTISIPETIWGLKKLTILDLSDNSWKIKSGKGAKEIRILVLSPKISELENLRYLNLSIKEGDTSTSVIIPDKISGLKKLKVLCLKNAKLSKLEVDRIRKLLPNCTVCDREDQQCTFCN